jgi:hypothetical protein
MADNNTNSTDLEESIGLTPEQQDQLSTYLNQLIVKIVKQLLGDTVAPHFKSATVDSVNSDGTINLITSGQSTVTHNYSNFTNCALAKNQNVMICSFDDKANNYTNAFVAYSFSKYNRLGYSGCFIDQDGLVCTKSDNSAQIKINSEVGLVTSKSNESGGWINTGGITPDGYSYFSRIVNPDVPDSYATIGADQLSHAEGLEMFKKINGTFTSIGTLFFYTDSEVPELGSTVWSLDSANYIGIYKTFSAGDLPTRMEFSVVGHEIMEIQTNWIHIDGDLTVNNISVDTVNAVTLNSTNLKVTGSKNCIIKTQDNGTVAVNSYETAEYYFGDLGEDTIENNVCIVNIEPIFKETVNTDIKYQVFLTPYGKGNIWVDERTSDCFTVKGDNINFGWEIKAKRKNYENVRLIEVKI